MNIVVDAFGGDNAPLEILKGSRMAADELGINITLVGNEKIINEVAKENNISLLGMKIVDAPDVITMEDLPTDIMKSKSESSMAKGLKMVASGEGDAFVSAGNSGALAVGATFIVKRIKGIKRCAFAPVVPSNKGHFMLIDSGANSECRPEMLKQFGLMGSIYMENIMLVKKPRVGLANIGTEPCKGDTLRQETYGLLKDSNLNFVGNIEARDIVNDAADVIVADGFTGNIILKLYEGMASVLFNKFKNVLTKNIKTKVAAMLIKKDLKAMKKESDYTEYGGAPLMGISKPVFKAHGSSDAKTFKNAIRLTAEYVKRDVSNLIYEAIKKERNNEKSDEN